jgi:adenylate kinase family enzyme
VETVSGSVLLSALVHRVSVVGNSGSGKSTLARVLAAVLRAPHLELDSINPQPGWQPLPVDDFRRAVEIFAAGNSWVIAAVTRPASWLTRLGTRRCGGS